MSEHERLKAKAHELRELEGRIEQVSDLLKGLTDKRHLLERVTLPALFAEAGLRAIQLDDGSRITLSTLAEGALPKDPDKRQQAIGWLVDNGYSDLIECKVTSSWVRGDRAKAEEEYCRLQARGDAKVLLDEGIHPRTLGARMRDRVVSGLETPLDLLGVAVFPRARFTRRSEELDDDGLQRTLGHSGRRSGT